MLKRFIFSLLSLTCYTSAQASPFGFNLSLPLVDKDPNYLHGFRAAVTYQPPCFIWKHFSVYFDAAYGHWWVNNNVPNKNLSIYSIAPYLRLYFVRNPTITPYVEASIGAAYLSSTRFAKRNLGIHYSFQDQLTIGAAFGPEQRLYVSLSGVHYSNGSMSSSNSGITIPVVLNVGYRF